MLFVSCDNEWVFTHLLNSHKHNTYKTKRGHCSFKAASSLEAEENIKKCSLRSKLTGWGECHQSSISWVNFHIKNNTHNIFCVLCLQENVPSCIPVLVTSLSLCRSWITSHVRWKPSSRCPSLSILSARVYVRCPLLMRTMPGDYTLCFTVNYWYFTLVKNSLGNIISFYSFYTFSTNVD